MKAFQFFTALVVAFTALINTGCAQDKTGALESVDIGLFVTSDEIPTAWNDRVRSKVVTTKGVFYVKGLVSLTTDSPVFLEKYSNGKTYFCSDQFKKCKKLYGL